LSLFAAAAATGTFAALYLFRAEDVPDVAQLDQHRPSIITRVFDRADQAIGEFAEERRVVVGYNDLPPYLLQAIIAVEDAGFYEHSGLNLRGILRAAIENAKVGRVVQGGSSLTQQLAKLMFLTPERSLKRKTNEAILALNIERTYSKEEIITFYCNQVYMGHNRYGVEAAARLYFGRTAADLELAEAALIAGLPQRPNAYSPYRQPEAALERRSHVLDRMVAEGFVTAAEADTARDSPLVLRPFRQDHNEIAPYFVEEVRQVLERDYGEKSLYHEGLHVHTTLDQQLQEVADGALRSGLLALDKRHGWRGPGANVLADSADTILDEYEHASWTRTPSVGDFVHGLVTSAGPERATVRVASLNAIVEEVPRWSRRRRISDLYQIGDVGYFRVSSVDVDGGQIGLAVEQEPEVEGALVALDVKTGEILAMVGGWDFGRSKFNRAVQAKRQTGSAFKPILYATALANGFTAADTLLDEPLAIEDPSTGKIYSPENYSRSYYGLTTVRTALEKSRNPVSVQLLQRIGPHAVIDMARRLGITAALEPYPSLALGAFETTLLEMTSAYAAFGDVGVLHEPYLIRRIQDREGNVLMERHPVSRQALSPEVAYLTTNLLRGVVQHGTARKARPLGGAIGGKTGTTDEFTDAWFIGYSPRVACGVWIGYDVKRSLGKGEVGAKAALPIWIDFMAEAIASRPEDDFVRPSGVEFVLIDKKTGLRRTDICRDGFREGFVRGTAPVSYCSARDHEIHALPYYMQKIYMAGGSIPPLSSGVSTTSTFDEPELSIP